MGKIFTTLLHEPLVHFLFIATLLYFYIDTTTPVQPSQQKPTITLSAYEIEALQTQTGITDKGLLKKYLFFKKLLLEEAYFLELYKNDNTIEKILLQKMEAVLGANTPSSDINETELRHYFQQHKKEFATPKSYTLSIIHIPNKQALNIFTTLTPFEDKLPYNTTTKTLTPQEIQDKYGKYTLLAIKKLPMGIYSPPLATSAGAYTIFKVKKKEFFTENPPVDFDNVEDMVYQHYMLTHKRKAAQKILQEIQTKYNFQELP